MAAVAVEGGFERPVIQSQAVFRALLDAMARPGTVADLGTPVSAPAPLAPAAAAVLAALADADTPVWLAGAFADAAGWLRFQTGCTIVADPAAAAFAVLGEDEAAASWDRFPIGTADYPDRSATLLLPVAALSGGAPLALTGPGIETVATIAPSGLPDGFLAAREADRARFPLGHDLLLVCGGALLALPRTTTIREA